MAKKDKTTRFLRWFRVLPILALAVSFAACATLAAAPTTLVAQTFYPVKYGALIQESAARHGVDPYLVAAVAKCESGWDAGACSAAGAVGVMQVMPSTALDLAERGSVDASEYDPNDLADPATNIEYGCAYLGVLSQELSSNEEVICAYNAGLAAVQGWLDGGGTVEQNVSFAETKYYLERVTQAYQGFKTCYPEGLPAEA